MAKINPVQVEKLLKGLDYPASKQDIIKYAEQHGADENAREALRHLPDQTFEGPIGVSKAIGAMDRGETGKGDTGR
jgi:hypothetical protein